MQPWGGGVGSRRLLASPTGLPPVLLWSRSRSPLLEPPPHSPPAAPVGRCDLPVLVPRRHGQWHVSRAGRAGTGLVKRRDMETSRHVLARAPPLARSGADGAPVCPLRLGQPSVLGWSRWSRCGCSARWAPFYAGHPACLRGPSQGPRRSAGPAGRGAACRSRESEEWRVGAHCRGGGGGGGRGRGHGPLKWRGPAGPGGWVAPGLCAAPEIPALGGRGARPRAEPTPPPPPRCRVGAWGGGGRGGWREGGGGGRLAEEVLVVLVDVKPGRDRQPGPRDLCPPPVGPPGAPPLRGRRPAGPRGGRVAPRPPGTPAGAHPRAAGG